MMIDENASLDKLFSAIREKDIDACIAEVEHLQSVVLFHPTLYTDVIRPATLTMLHDNLVDAFSIDRRYFQLKRKIDSRRRRAFLFLQAILNGLRTLK